MGPPGSGKGTQGRLIADAFDLVTIDTGHILRKIFARATTQQLKKEKKLNDSGKLNTPSFVLNLLTRAITSVAKTGDGLICTGSPRTLYEAFGDSKKEGVVQTLERLYGKKNVFFIILLIPQKASISRAMARRGCKTCGAQLLSTVKGTEDLSRCPFCAGVLIKRTDDVAHVMETRLREYATRTEPIINTLRSTKRRVFFIDGTKLPYAIFDQIARILL